MASGFARLLSVCASFLAPILPAAAQPDLNPPNTWVFVVGLLKFENNEEFSNFPLKNRRDAQLAEFFKKRGVPADQIVYLQDANAKLARIESEFDKLLKRTNENSLLIVYYSGHGFIDDGVFFASFDSSVGDVDGWPVKKIVGKIESAFQGSDAMIIADCCHSGALVNAIERIGSKVNYACLASSSRRKISTENWTFTEAFLAALQGDPEVDLDRDGFISLEEADTFTENEMLYAEDQKITSFLSDTWSGPTILSKARKLSDSKIGAHVKVKYGGTLYKGRVTARNGNQFRVFFYGYEKADEEWVDADDIIWQE